MKKRILFIMSDTGGGHRASALAIQEAIHHLYPDTYETIIEDIWKNYTPWPINRISQMYPQMTGGKMQGWKLMWQLSMILPSRQMLALLAPPILGGMVARYLKTVQPDIIVSVHPLMNHLAVAVRHKAGLSPVPVVTVVTDMVSLHPTWICPQVTRCTVPTEPARELALKWGMPPEKVIVTGQPVSLKFARLTGSRESHKIALGLPTDRPAVLLVGGGEGHGPLFETARAIAASVSKAQLMVVAGRNIALKQKLESVQWEIPTRIFGFVTTMPDLMAATDIIVTKAGPGTICEAFIAGVPVILSGYIPGQEEGNVTYVQQHQAGVLAETPQAVAAVVADWLNPTNTTLTQLKANAANLAYPEAALTIAAQICNLI